jgi:hypothetical protein
MDPQVGASFIPKKPLAEVRGSRGGAYGLLFVLALLFFVASIVAAGASFLYLRYLNVSLNSKKISLEKYEQAYELSTIQTLIRADSRINEAKKILTKHLSPSTIFDFLSQQTLEKVQFISFDYSYGAEGKITMSLKGIADSFATVALQSDQFGASKVLKDVIFGGITIDQGGKVGFDVSATIDPSFVLYTSAIKGVPEAAASSTSSTSSGQATP